MSPSPSTYAAGARLAVLAASALGLAPAAPVSAATTKIGAVQEIEAATAPFEPSGGGDAVQIAEASGSYAVPVGYGVITAWEHSAGSAGGTLEFKVFRPTETAGRFLTVASTARAVSAGSVHTYAVRIPVRPGDRLGLSSATETVQLAYQTFNPVDQLAFLPIDSNPQPGSTVTQDGQPATGLKLDVAAKLESDADADGFGDDSQDRCPDNAAAQGACPTATPLRALAECAPSAANVIDGTPAANAISGTPAGDRIFAGGGDDAVDGLAGDDCLDLGTGADRGDGGDGADLLLGGPGRDRLQGGPGADLVLGGDGRDRLGGRVGDDRLRGGGGNDRIAGGGGRDVIDGASGDDVIGGGPGGDRVSGGGGRDRIDARDGRRDRIACGPGRDTVRADRVDRVDRDCERVRR